MKGLFSLEQELRAARTLNGRKNEDRPVRTREPKESARPWQSDIDQLQQTMREVLRVVASLSGVELPGLPPGLQDDEAPPPRLDIKTVKDRFRNDLEGFSIKVTEELTKQAKERTQAALGAVQSEARGSIDQVAAEFREQLELPAHIEKLVKPCVEKAAARLEQSLSEKVEHLVAEHEKLVHERLQGVESSFQTQISTLEQTVQQIRALKAGSDAELSAERRSTAELAGRIDQVAAEVRGRLQDQVEIEKLVEPSVEGVVAKLEKSLCQRVEHLVAEHEQLIQERLQGTLSSVQAQVSALEQTVKQIREMKAESVAKALAEKPSTVADNETKENESAPSDGLIRFVDQAFSRIERSFNSFTETPANQPDQAPGAGLGERPNPIPFSDSDREARIQQALDQLGRLGTKDPHPAS